MLKFIAFYYPIITHPFFLVIFISLCSIFAIFIFEALFFPGKPWYKLLWRKDDPPDR